VEVLDKLKNTWQWLRYWGEDLMILGTTGIGSIAGLVLGWKRGGKINKKIIKSFLSGLVTTILGFILGTNATELVKRLLHTPKGTF